MTPILEQSVLHIERAPLLEDHPYNSLKKKSNVVLASPLLLEQNAHNGLLFLSFFFFFWNRVTHINQDRLKLIIFLPHPSQYWDYKHMLSHYKSTFKKWKLYLGSVLNVWSPVYWTSCTLGPVGSSGHNELLTSCILLQDTHKERGRDPCPTISLKEMPLMM